MAKPSTKGYGAARTGAGFSGTTSDHGGKPEAKPAAKGHKMTTQAAHHHKRRANQAALMARGGGGLPMSIPVAGPTGGLGQSPAPMPAGAVPLGPDTAPQAAPANMAGGAPNLGM